MAANTAAAKKQQGESETHSILHVRRPLTSMPDLQMQYSTFKNTIQQLAQKIGDVEQERDEHMCAQLHFLPPTSAAGVTATCNMRRLILCLSRAVLETLEPLAGDRKCFRMINGVLVEMTVKDVLPPLKTNTEGLKEVGKGLEAQLISKQKELDEWKVSHATWNKSYFIPWTC